MDRTIRIPEIATQDPESRTENATIRLPRSTKASLELLKAERGRRAVSRWLAQVIGEAVDHARKKRA